MYLYQKRTMEQKVKNKCFEKALARLYPDEEKITDENALLMIKEEREKYFQKLNGLNQEFEQSMPEIQSISVA